MDSVNLSGMAIYRQLRAVGGYLIYNSQPQKRGRRWRDTMNVLPFCDGSSRINTRLLIFCLVLSVAALFVVAPAHATRAENGTTFDGPGGKIYYEVIGGGNAIPLVLVNGGPGLDHSYLHTSTAWDVLARSRRVIFYDQRGNGRSSPLKEGQSCTLADQIDDLDALRAHLGLEKMILLGSSWGGYLSMAYAARHAERVAGLILVDSAGPKWDEKTDLDDKVYPEAVEREKSLEFAMEFRDLAAKDQYNREDFSMLFYSPEKRDAFLALLMPIKFNWEVNESVSHDLARFDLTPELPKFRFPTLVITGRFDMNVAPVFAYQMYRAIPSAQFTVFEKSGHLPFTEEPDAFASRVESFLGTIPSGL
jgi:proline iminopeptidase